MNLQNPYLDPKNEQKPDSYYKQKSREAVDEAIRQSEGKSPAEVRSAIRRNYPFGNGDRKGRPYKIWNGIALEVEERLGLPKQTRTTRKTKLNSH